MQGIYLRELHLDTICLSWKHLLTFLVHLDYLTVLTFPSWKSLPTFFKFVTFAICENFLQYNVNQLSDKNIENFQFGDN